MLVDVLVELGDWTIRAAFAIFLFSVGLSVIGSLAMITAILFGGLR